MSEAIEALVDEKFVVVALVVVLFVDTRFGKVLSAVVVATKYGAEIKLVAEMIAGVMVPDTARSPVMVVVARAVLPAVKVPAVRLVNEAFTPESDLKSESVPPRKSPLVTMRPSSF